MRTGGSVQGTGARLAFVASVVLATSLLTAPRFAAQEIRLDGAAPRAAAGHVSLLSENVTVQAGKPDVIELRFHVDPGFHINSHAPKDELLIPTVLKLDGTPAVAIQEADYPAGRPFKLELGSDSQMLSVYQDDFRIGLRVEAVKAGQTTLTGSLRYQACDHASCYPAKTLPLKILLTAR